MNNKRRNWYSVGALLLILILTVSALVACDESGKTAARGIIVKSYLDGLVNRYAPIHYQDVDKTGDNGLEGRSDYITAVDFDGDWIAWNNWQNIRPRAGYQAVGHCYYSLVLTETHAFIIYAFYHPRDWSQLLIGWQQDTHENDMEGLLAIVELPGRVAEEGFDYGDYGTLKAIVTVFHNDFYSYISIEIPTEERFGERDESIDGMIWFTDYGGIYHPTTGQECHGHGLKAWPSVDIEGGDGIIYYPTWGNASEPSGEDDILIADYNLVDIFVENGLWDHRYNSDTFASYGVFNGNDYVANAAHAPWKWDDTGGFWTGTSADQCPEGVIATDPIVLVQSYFTGLGNFSETYILNPYQEIDFIWPD